MLALTRAVVAVEQVGDEALDGLAVHLGGCFLLPKDVVKVELQVLSLTLGDVTVRLLLAVQEEWVLLLFRVENDQVLVHHLDHISATRACVL